MSENQTEIKKTPDFTFQGKILLFIALLLSIGYTFFHSSLFTLSFYCFGIGWSITLFLGLIFGLWGIQKTKGLHFSRENIFLFVITLLLSSTFTLFSDFNMQLLNLPLSLLLCVWTLNSFAGQYDSSPFTFSFFFESLRRLFPSFFRFISVPFQYIKQNIKQKKAPAQSHHILTGFLFSLPVLAFMVILLANADSIFDGFVHQLFSSFQQINFRFFWNIFKAVLLSLIAFSFLFSLTQQKKELYTLSLPSIPAASYAVLLYSLCVIYGIFVYIQMRYLFLNSKSLTIPGGYAQYARSGFFQLFFVSFLTAVMILPALHYKKAVSLRIACMLLSFLTLFIVFSAFFRMRLYVQEYGLSFLRLLTLWGILMIFIVFLFFLTKSLFPKFSVVKPLLILLLVSWTLFSLINPSSQVARYNVQAFNRGNCEHLDTQYLIQLSPEVLPALEKIKDEEIRSDAIQEAEAYWQHNLPRPYDWSLGFRHVPKKFSDSSSY